jgi:hypothetical protein
MMRKNSEEEQRGRTAATEETAEWSMTGGWRLATRATD